MYMVVDCGGDDNYQNVSIINLNLYVSIEPWCHLYLTLNLLTTTVVAPPGNASKWQMGFNSAFKGLIPTRLKPLV